MGRKHRRRRPAPQHSSSRKYYPSPTNGQNDHSTSSNHPLSSSHHTMSSNHPSHHTMSSNHPLSSNHSYTDHSSALVWTRLDSSRLIPQRGFHSTVCATLYQEDSSSPMYTNSSPPIYITGGDNQKSFFSDVWRLTPYGDAQKLPPMPIPRTGHSCTFYNGALFVFGGRLRSRYFNDMIRFVPSSSQFLNGTWERVVPLSSSSLRIRPRAAHTACVVNHKLYIFGGITSSNEDRKLEPEMQYLNSMVVYDFLKNEWEIPAQYGSIPRQRAGHAMTVIDNNIFIFGGRMGSLLYQDFFMFNTTDRRWIQLIPEGKPPSARAGHSLVAFNNKLLLWGGSNWKHFWQELSLFDCESQQWTVFPETGEAPQGKFWHSCTVVGDKMYVFGGGNNHGLSNQLHCLDLSPLLHHQIDPHSNTIDTLKTESPLSPNHKKEKSNKIQQKNDVVKVKASYNSELRVYRCSTRYQDLLATVRREYSKSHISITYTDDDNDRITIKSASEWQDCIEHFQKLGKVVRLDLIDHHERNGVGLSSPNPFSPRNAINNYPSDESDGKEPKFQWQKGRQLGSGAFGKVYLGLNIETSSLMAVKQIKFKKAQVHQNTVHEIMNEINLMKRLSHDNIVRYFGVEKTDTYLNIFMEYVAGGSIAACVKTFFSFHESVVRNCTKQILTGLKYLHDNDIVHRDIKAANLLFSTDGVIKLADFGHSKQLSTEVRSRRSALSGTPLWMSPESIRGEVRQGKPSDIWALGCTIIEMITGQVPWVDLLQKFGNNELTLMFKIANSGQTPKMPSTLSETGKRFLERCFDLDPKTRATVEELLQHDFVLQKLDYAPMPLPQSVSEIEEDIHHPPSVSEELTDDDDYEEYEGLSDFDTDSDEMDESEIIFAETTKGSESKEAEESLRSLEMQMAKVNRLHSRVSQNSTLVEQSSASTIARSQEDILSYLKNENEKNQSSINDIQQLSQRTARVSERRKKKISAS